MDGQELEFITVSQQGRVGIITLNRPKALNAINSRMARELADTVARLDQDDGIGCMVLTGGDKVFCAGADIKEALHETYPQTLTRNFLAGWDALSAARKPLVAAITGPALGGGCEIAMMCDLIIADETARFALPEIRLGLMPGAGGTQRMAQALGKARTMDICLTGRPLLADEADRLGLLSRLVPAGQHEVVALEVAEQIANASLPAVMAIKEAVVCAGDGLHQGLKLERRLFQALYATADRVEGMTAFAERRTPVFRHV